MTVTDAQMNEATFRERMTHIDEMLVNVEHRLVDIQRINIDNERRRQEIRYQPWIVGFTGIAAVAALIGATIALTKLFLPG